MQHSKLMTAILNDGSQITGTETAQSIHGDKITLVNDDQAVNIDLLLCQSYLEAVDPIGFDELTPAEAAELEKLENLSALLTRQSY